MVPHKGPLNRVCVCIQGIVFYCVTSVFYACLLISGSFQVNGVVPQANGESSKVKVKVRVNINGLFNVSGATITEKVENPPTADEPEPMDVDGSAEKVVLMHAHTTV